MTYASFLPSHHNKTSLPFPSPPPPYKPLLPPQHPTPNSLFPLYFQFCLWFMGSCLSFHSEQIDSVHRRPTAKVIAADGSLKEYSATVTASSVLGRHRQACFLCSSDKLFLDADVPALASDERLQPGQIYFVLPAARLGRPLKGADMVALVVKASAALGLDSEKKGGRRSSKVQVMPVVAVYEGVGDGETDGFKAFAAGLPARSIAVKNMGRSKIGTRGGLMERQPFQGRLGTIFEEADE